LHRAKSESVHRPPADQPYKFGAHIFSFHQDDGPGDADLALILAAPELLSSLEAIANAVMDITVERRVIRDAALRAIAQTRKAP